MTSQRLRLTGGVWACFSCSAELTESVIDHRPRCTKVRPDGAALWHEIVAKHGVDRCPTIEGQALWACGEMGELAQEIAKARFAGWGLEKDPAAVARELGDAGLALYGLAFKLGLDLPAEMARVVDNEVRRFTCKRTSYGSEHIGHVPGEPCPLDGMPA